MAKEKVKVAYKDSGNMVYCLGIIGALFYYVGQVDGFWNIILAILKAFVWPAFFVYDILQYIGA